MRWRCGRQRDDGNYQSITCMNSHPMNHSQAARAPSCHSVVQNVNSARDLGAQPDSELSVQDRQHNTCYHLRKLYQFRSYVSQAVTIQLLMSLAMTNIDYCNSVLAGLLASTLAPLQCVQNSTARLIRGLDQRLHITPASCKTLHRPPVKYRVFKLAKVMHNIFRRRSSPPYLSDLITFCVDDVIYVRRRSPLFVKAVHSPSECRTSGKEKNNKVEKSYFVTSRKP